MKKETKKRFLVGDIVEILFIKDNNMSIVTDITVFPHYVHYSIKMKDKYSFVYQCHHDELKLVVSPKDNSPMLIDIISI